MSIAEGNVYGLKPYLNDWLQRKEQLMQLVPPLLSPGPVLLVGVAEDEVIEANGGSGPDRWPDGRIDYTLLYERGTLRVWRLLDFAAAIWKPSTDLLGCLGWEQGIEFVSIGAQTDNFALCDPLCIVNTWGSPPWERLYFLTMALPWSRDNMRDQNYDYVVAIVDGPATWEQAEIWAALLDQFAPDALTWLLDGPQVVQAGETFAEGENDPFKKEGADR